MSTELVYVSPHGEFLDEHDDYHGDEYPGSDEALDFLLSLGESYWQDPTGSGQGTFELARDKIVVATFAVTRIDRVGFWLNPWTTAPFVATNERQDPDVWIPLMNGGDTEHWPAVFFHPFERTRQAIWQFCESVSKDDIQLPSTLTWVSIEESGVNDETRTYNRDLVNQIRNYSK